MRPKALLLIALIPSLLMFWLGLTVGKLASIIPVAPFQIAMHKSTISLGAYQYGVSFSDKTLGLTVFPPDDKNGQRQIVLPTLHDQQSVSLMHEEIHACMHNHDHHFKSAIDLYKHLHETTYSEEAIATLLAPCLLEAEHDDRPWAR